MLMRLNIMLNVMPKMTMIVAGADQWTVTTLLNNFTLGEPILGGFGCIQCVHMHSMACLWSVKVYWMISECINADLS